MRNVIITLISILAYLNIFAQGDSVDVLIDSNAGEVEANNTVEELHPAGNKNHKDAIEKSAEKRRLKLVLSPNFLMNIGTVNTFGFSVESGIELGFVQIGACFNFALGSGESPDELYKIHYYEHPILGPVKILNSIEEFGFVFELDRKMIGGGGVLYLNVVNIKNKFKIFSGIAGGYWTITDKVTGVKRAYDNWRGIDYTDDPVSMDFIQRMIFNGKIYIPLTRKTYQTIGPKIKMVAGSNHVFFRATGTALFNKSKVTIQIGAGVSFVL